MTIFFHGATGLLVKKFERTEAKNERKLFTYLLFILMGMLPDIIGEVGKWITNDYTYYNEVHGWGAIIICSLIILIGIYTKDRTYWLVVPYLVHVLIDAPFHGGNGLIDLGYTWYKDFGVNVFDFFIPYGEVIAWAILIFIYKRFGRT